MIKNKRNDPCYCGSGLKYKKCCLARETSVSGVFDQKNKPIQHLLDNHKGAPVLMTTTNEPFMPIRLYYTIYNRKKIYEILHNLSCIGFAEHDHFYISYWKEIQNFGLSVNHNDVPKPLYPIILAHGFINEDHTLHLNLRSFKRGLKMIEWINHHIHSSYLKLTHIASYNALTHTSDIESTMSHDFNEFFPEHSMKIIDPQAIVKQFKTATQHTHDCNEKARIVEQIMKRLEEEEDFAYIEKYPVHYYEDGIQGIKLGLDLRMMVAFEHWQGNTACKLEHIIRRVYSSE